MSHRKTDGANGDAGGDERLQTKMPKARAVLLAAVLILLSDLLLITGEALAQPNLHSAHRTNEFDTTDRGGQAGGIGWGSGYAFRTLRCGNGEAIVGAKIRRGDVLDYIQVMCAAPVCAGGNCQWNGGHWGAWAGNPNGGDPHNAMICAQDEMLSGFKARVVTFTTLDYAADIEIQCSRIASADGANGPFRVTPDRPNWHHPEGGLRIGGYLPPNFRSTQITNVISCRPYGGATAISTGVSNFVILGQRVVQAVSLLCPASRPTQDTSLYPHCLYNTAPYMSGQVVRLRADTLVQGLPASSYNCFAYAETFITGGLPNALPLVGRQFVTITRRWLGQHNYAMIAAANTLDQLPSARLGDLVMVQNRTDTSVGAHEWYHAAIVIGVDSAGSITRLRQKPDENRCVFDTTANQFATVDPVQDGEQYELWRNPSFQWSAAIGP